MRARFLLPLAALTGIFAAACDDGLDTTHRDDDPADDGSATGDLGVIELSLEAGDTPIDQLTATITVTPSGGGASVNVVRTFASLGVHELIRVAPGTYNIGVAVTQEGDATPAYTGQATNVTVLAGQRSAVAVPLTPTGGVQIAVTLPTLGSEIVCQPSVDVSAAQLTLRAGVQGVQRVERGADNVWRPTYYLWLCGSVSCRMIKTTVVDGAKNPLWDGSTAVSTNLATLTPTDGSAMWATGAGFFALNEFDILQSTDGITWTTVAKAPRPSFTAIRGTSSSGGQLRGCGIFVDDAVHRLCNVIDEYKPASGNANLMGLAMTSSPDGFLWGAFPPILDGVTDRVTMPEVAFLTTPRSGAGHPAWWENEEQLVGTALHGGVYLAIVAQMSTTLIDGQRVPLVYDFVTHSSADGEHWIQREVGVTCAGGIPRPKSRSGWATFVVDGALHIYYPTSGTDLAHLTSAK